MVPEILLVIIVATAVVGIMSFFEDMTKIWLTSHTICALSLIWLFTSFHYVDKYPKVKSISMYTVHIVDNIALIIDEEPINLNKKMNMNFKDGDSVRKTDVSGFYKGIYLKDERWNIIKDSELP